MAFTREVEPVKGDPPVDPEYHCIADPVAVKSATVGLAPEQKVCEAEPVGAAGIAIPVPLAAAFTVVAPPPETAILPLYDCAAVGVNFTKITCE